MTTGPGRLLSLADRRPALLAGVSGALAALSQAPASLPFVTILGLAGAALVLSAAPTLRRAAWAGWVFGLSYFAVSLHWLVEPFLVDAPRHGWMAPFALFFMAGGLALFWALAFGLSARLSSPPARLTAWVGLMTLAEFARSVVFTGFPWALLGYGLLPGDIALLAAWIGPHGLTLLALASAGLVAGAVRSGAGARQAAGVVLVLGLPIGVGQALVQMQSPPSADGPVVRIVQPNIPQDEKWNPDLIARNLSAGLALTVESGSPDLVVWPETAVPYLLEYAGPTLEAISSAAGGAPVVTGLQRREGPLFFNSLVVLGAGGQPQGVYDKFHLVPFGEYIPLGDWLARFGIRGLAANEGGGFGRGPGPALVGIPGIGTAQPLICYEGIFAHQVAPGSLDRPDFLLLITNDAWFGGFSGPYQHFDQARMRAIEQGLPVVRAANTGVSGIIDGHGRVTARLDLGERGVVDAPLPQALQPTLYARLGDLPALVAAGLLLVGTLRRRDVLD